MARTTRARPLRVAIHVRPGASRTEVGGDHDGALVVKVAAPPERGAATEAALAALAAALGLPRRAVDLAQGATSRSKVVEVMVEGPRAAACEERLGQLRAATGSRTAQRAAGRP